jgi:farnesyl diphosphate synthase
VSFSERLAADAALIEARLQAVLADRADQPVTSAMRYAVQGGKRLRGFLVLEGARMLGVAEDVRHQRGGGGRGAACLLAWSMTICPAMDDDDLRRGQPTVHQNGTRRRRFWRAMHCRRWPSSS